MADGFDIVAVGIAEERAVIVGMVLGPYLGLMQYLRPDGHTRFEECPDRGPVGRGECNMRLMKAFTGASGCDPEIRLGSDSVSDDVSEIYDPFSAQRSEDGVVEGSAGVDVDALDGEVIKHRTTLRGSAFFGGWPWSVGPTSWSRGPEAISPTAT